jgi:hypothetical protein
MSEDLFDRPVQRAGKYPKAEELEGSLLLIKPEKVELVANRFAKKPSDPTHVERATATTVVLGPDGTEEYPAMYWSQQVVISACTEALKPGAKPWVLGRLVKVAQKATREALEIDNTPEAFAEARTKWLRGGGKGTEPKGVWVLADFDDADAARARDYIAGLTKAQDPFASTPA